MITGFPSFGAVSPRAVLLGAACVSVGFVLGSLIPTRKKSEPFTRSPKSTALASLSAEEIQSLPYPPDIFPGGRDVSTPYGSIRVFEWGPEDGEKVLFVHGISTPTIALGDLAHELVGKGYRVMLFGKRCPDMSAFAKFEAHRLHVQTYSEGDTRTPRTTWITTQDCTPRKSC